MPNHDMDDMLRRAVMYDREKATEQSAMNADPSLLSEEQWSQLTLLKTQVKDDPEEMFTTKERNRLRFMRWRVAQGHFTEDDLHLLSSPSIRSAIE